MQGYDILMLGVMAFATLRGYLKGLAWQISSIASIVVSYIVAYRLRDRVAAHIEMPDPWGSLIAMLGLFVGCSLLIWFLFQNISEAIEKAKLKDFDKQLGAIFGAVKGAAWCTVITLFCVSMLRPQMSQEIVNSRSGGYIARILASSKSVIPTQVQEVIQPYIDTAEARLQGREASDPIAPEGRLLEQRLQEWYRDQRDGDPLEGVSQSPEERRWQ